MHGYITPARPKHRLAWLVVLFGLLEIAAIVAFVEVKGFASTVCSATVAVQGFPLILAAITTQIRPGELYALDWEHVDLKHRIVQVTRTMPDTKKGAVVGRKPKTRNSIRKVRIPQVLADALERARAGSNSPYVFPSPDGARLRRQNVQRRWWKPLLEAAGLPDITFYELRSSGANIADKIPDVSRAILSARMGHTDTKTTEIYLDPDVVLQSPIADRFDEVLKSFRAAVPPSTVPTAVPTKGGSAVRGKEKARY